MYTTTERHYAQRDTMHPQGQYPTWFEHTLWDGRKPVAVMTTYPRGGASPLMYGQIDSGKVAGRTMFLTRNDAAKILRTWRSA